MTIAPHYPSLQVHAGLHASPATMRKAAPAKLDASLDDSERKQVERLARRDREVRAHEAAHQTAGGAYAGAARYEYERGPNGQQYAVNGEVPIDASDIPGDTEATIEKMEQVKTAAMAPAAPSGQDRRVAALADAAIARAQSELREREKSGEGAPQATGEKLNGTLTQSLAEMREAGPSGNSDASAATEPDLAAYATAAYRHQAEAANRALWAR